MRHRFAKLWRIHNERLQQNFIDNDNIDLSIDVLSEMRSIATKKNRVVFPVYKFALVGYKTRVHRYSNGVRTAYATGMYRNILFVLLLKKLNSLWLWFCDACLFASRPLASGFGGRCWLPTTFLAASLREHVLLRDAGICTVASGSAVHHNHANEGTAALAQFACMPENDSSIILKKDFPGIGKSRPSVAFLTEAQLSPSMLVK